MGDGYAENSREDGTCCMKISPKDETVGGDVHLSAYASGMCRRTILVVVSARAFWYNTVVL